MGILNLRKFEPKSPLPYSHFSRFSLSRTRKGPKKDFVRHRETFEQYRNRESSIDFCVNVQGTDIFVRDRENFDIEGSRDRESPQ